MKYKSKNFKKFKQFKAWIENKTRRKILCLRMDKDGEYMSIEFSNYLRNQGIKHQLTMPIHLYKMAIVSARIIISLNAVGL